MRKRKREGEQRRQSKDHESRSRLGVKGENKEKSRKSRKEQRDFLRCLVRYLLTEKERSQ